MKNDAALLLDDVDLKILRALELDARRQNQDIAESIGMSASACLSRVRRLEQNGVIRRYLTELDLTAALPCIELSGEIRLMPVTHAVRASFEQRLCAAREVLRAFQMVGRADYCVEVAGADASMWPNLLRRLDPDADIIAKATAQLKLRVVKHFAGTPQLGVAPLQETESS